MKILQLTHNYPTPIDMTEGIFLHRINRLLIKKNDITVVVLHPNFRAPSIIDEFAIDGVNILLVNYFRPRGRLFNSLDGFFMLSAIPFLSQRTKNFDILHSHWQSDGALLGTFLSKKFQKPHIVSVRGARIFTKSSKSVYGLVSSYVFKNSTLIHTNGLNIKIELKRKYQIPEYKLKWIPNIIFNKKSLANLLKISLGKAIVKDSYTFLFIGLDGKNKGLLDTVHSFLMSNTKRHQLIIVTDTSGSFYKKFIQPLIFDKMNITVMNKLPPKHVTELFIGADVFLFPSYGEGSPNVVIEAMASGCYIISYKIPGLEELIIHNRNGRLVKTKDIASLSREINLFVSGSMGNYFSKFKEYNYNFVVNNYNSDRIVDDYLSMYKESTR